MVNTPNNDETLVNKNQVNISWVEKQKTITVDSIKDILSSNWEKVVLTDEQIQDIIGGKKIVFAKKGRDRSDEVQYDYIRIIANCLKNLNIEKIKDFISRKKEYLERNRTISEEKFKELFWWSWKFWKAEINQWALWLCFAYSWIELLKKTNWFDEMIQTNLKETENWWEVRLPFCDVNWKRIKVSKNEIDKQIVKVDKEWKEKILNINSNSDLLWFKIIEIAYMKKSLIDYRNNLRSDIKQLQNEYEKTWDFQLTYDVIDELVGKWDVSWPMKVLYWNSLICLEANGVHENLKDLAFKYHEKWLYKIGLQPDRWDHTLNNIKIIRKNLNQLKDECEEIIIKENWEKAVFFDHMHTYSIEKCYIDKNTWEKRVRVVNPHHTWIKFDMSLEECKSVFRWEVVGIDIDKMFR